MRALYYVNHSVLYYSDMRALDIHCERPCFIILRYETTRELLWNTLYDTIKIWERYTVIVKQPVLYD